MLTLFQNITEELTPFEKTSLVPLLIDVLSSTHEGNRFKGATICSYFHACRHEVSPARLRKLINYIRVMNVKKGLQFDIGAKVVIGASNGYFVTDDPKVIEDQIESLQGRCDSMAAVIDSLKAQLQNLKRVNK